MRRDYKLFVPAPRPGQPSPRPLVVLLHGCGQDPDDFARGTAMNEAADAQGCYVLYPAQSRMANAQGCWNWFKHGHQARGHGEPALLAAMTREIIQHHPIDARRVYVAGLSAGGAMAAILAQAYPELYAALGVHSGLAPGVAVDVHSALMAMKGLPGARSPRAASGVPLISFHGDADHVVHASNSHQLIAAHVGAADPAQVRRLPGGHLRDATRSLYRSKDGRMLAELWTIHGAPHGWSGGRAEGSFTDPLGPSATAQMLRFFLESNVMSARRRTPFFWRRFDHGQR